MYWYPIETAPKDGTILLLYLAEPIDRYYASPKSANRYAIGSYDGGWHSVESVEEIWGWGSEMTGPMMDTDRLECTPSHWRPLNPPS